MNAIALAIEAKLAVNCSATECQKCRRRVHRRIIIRSFYSLHRLTKQQKQYSRHLLRNWNMTRNASEWVSLHFLQWSKCTHNKCIFNEKEIYGENDYIKKTLSTDARQTFIPADRTPTTHSQRATTNNVALHFAVLALFILQRETIGASFMSLSTVSMRIAHIRRYVPREAVGWTRRRRVCKQWQTDKCQSREMLFEHWMG